eukprot:CAMPEP_0197130162 /NCGR_PEP_ID=MMETSP1390-20130617/18873_1 /TAXON_ID=38833 /ORGANISM="Micromonas sp., Strain CCMP2099" /LENGTH=43 /DNA_ID= /DNA_START= /DNA_END= /DNA_ORIENTATION=
MSTCHTAFLSGDAQAETAKASTRQTAPSCQKNIVLTRSHLILF